MNSCSVSRTSAATNVGARAPVDLRSAEKFWLLATSSSATYRGASSRAVSGSKTFLVQPQKMAAARVTIDRYFLIILHTRIKSPAPDTKLRRVIRFKNSETDETEKRHLSGLRCLFHIENETVFVKKVLNYVNFPESGIPENRHGLFGKDLVYLRKALSFR